MRIAVTVVLSIWLCAVSVSAQAARHFTFTYEATVADPGEIEYAQWVTWKHRSDEDPGLDRFEFRHEFELGLSERWQLALYVPDWSYQRSDTGPDDHAEFEDVAAETIYQLSDPRTQSFGVALYGEVRLGDEIAAVEPKLIVQKNIGDWILAWNLSGEAEWEGERYDEDNGVVEQSLGISRRLGQSEWWAGVEAVHEIEYADWREWEKPAVYAGPTLAYHGHEWWLGFTPTAQLSDNDEEADVQARLILGVEFE